MVSASSLAVACLRCRSFVRRRELATSSSAIRRVKPFEVGGGINDDERVGLWIGRDEAVFRDQRLERGSHLGCIDLTERDEAGDVLLVGERGFRLRQRAEARLLGVFGRNDADRRAARHGREALHLQHRLKDLVGLVGGDLGRRHHAHLALDAVVHDEVLAGDLAHELDQDGEIDVLEVHGDVALAVGLDDLRSGRARGRVRRLGGCRRAGCRWRRRGHRAEERRQRRQRDRRLLSGRERARERHRRRRDKRR